MNEVKNEGCVVVERDPMKFLNGDESLSGIIDDLMKSGEMISMPNKEDFYEAILNTDWDE